MLETGILFDICIVIAAATVLALIASLLRQPIIPAYVLAGIIIGPIGLGLITNVASIRVLAELGVAFLLFIVGMRIDISKLKDVTFVSAVAGVVQVFLCFALGFLLALYLGFLPLHAIYIGLMLAFSSTVLVIKILADKNEIETLHGRILIGILLIQDILAVISLSVLMVIGVFSLNVLTTAILKGIGLFSIAIVCARYIFPPLIRRISKSHEVLFLTAVSTCLVFGILAHVAGFSIAIGGFLAGISLAIFPYNLEIISRVMPLKDFFATMFFVSLGMLLVFTPLTDFVIPVVIITLLVVIFKPFITNILVSLCGYERRTAFISGLGLGQSSEFSLIIAFLGLSLGHVSPSIFSMVVIITIATFIITTYLFKFEDHLYKLLARFLVSFEKFGPFNHKLERMPRKKDVKKHVIVCGAHRMGHEIIKTLQKLKKDFLVVDYNPEVIKNLVKRGIHCIYGNVRHAEVLEKLRLQEAQLIISTIPAEDTNLFLLKKAKEVNPDTTLVITATTPSDALLFYENGADYVIIPKIVSGEKASYYLYNLFRSKEYAKEIKRSEITSLRRRKEMQILEAHDIAKTSREPA